MRLTIVCCRIGPAAAIAVAMAGMMLSGCSTWSKLTTSQKTLEEQRKYGSTADQRIETLQADAAKAKAGGQHDRVEFTRGLVEAMLAEHDPRVRCGIVEIAAGFDTPAAVAISKGALEDPDVRVRMAACTAWRTRGGAEAVDMLASRYRSDREIDVRLRALRELGQLGDKEAVPVLAKALEDPDPAVQYRAVAALKQVSGRDLGDDVNRWREWAADPDGSTAEWSIAEGFRQLF
ncbi:MAG: HEAT repeat domain-containing protein [Pirellulales bacterium]